MLKHRHIRWFRFKAFAIKPDNLGCHAYMYACVYTYYIQYICNYVALTILKHSAIYNYKNPKESIKKPMYSSLSIRHSRHTMSSSLSNHSIFQFSITFY